MKRLIWVTLALLTGAAACGETKETPAASDYQGFYTMRSMTLGSEEGFRTITRAATHGKERMTLRGDVKVTAFDDDVLLSGRQALLVDGLIGNGSLQPIWYGAKLDGKSWLIETSTGTQVFDVELEHGELILLGRPHDPRASGTGAPPARIVLDRSRTWSERTVGLWRVVSMTLPDAGKIVTDTCLDIGDGKSAEVTFTLSIDSTWLMHQSQTVRTYSDPACTDLFDTKTNTREGLVEEEEGTLMRVWGFDRAAPADSDYAAFTIQTLRNDQTAMRRVDCLPAGCDATAPLEIVVEPQPFVIELP